MNTITPDTVNIHITLVLMAITKSCCQEAICFDLISREDCACLLERCERKQQPESIINCLYRTYLFVFSFTSFFQLSHHSLSVQYKVDGKGHFRVPVIHFRQVNSPIAAIRCPLIFPFFRCYTLVFFIRFLLLYFSSFPVSALTKDVDGSKNEAGQERRVADLVSMDLI